MRQRTYTVSNSTDLREAISGMRQAMAGARQSLLLVLDRSFDEARLRDMLAELRAELPGVSVAGITSHSGGENYPAPAGDVVLSLLCFEESGFEFALSELEQSAEHCAAAETAERLAAIPHARGVLVLSAGLVPQLQAYMKKLGLAAPDVPIFGAAAAFHAREDGVCSLLVCDGRILTRGILAIIFHGERLSVLADETFGWTPLGKRMTVTDASAAGNVVKAIDGRPAADIYSRYLGLSANQIHAVNVCEFPLVKRSGGRSVARISVRAYEDGSVQFGAPLARGDEVRFSYGNPGDILADAARHAEAARAFEPQALLLVCCMNRRIFLGKAQEQEMRGFRAAQGELAAIYGNSELFLDRLGGGELNSALVYAAMREGPVSDAPQAAGEAAAPERPTISGRVPLAWRLLTFLDVTTRELEDLEQNLEDEVERKTEEISRQRDALSRVHEQIVMALSNAIDAKDSYTNGHSRRVAEYSREIARRWGYDRQRLEDVYVIGLLHDVGKIGVPDAIINKPGRLTDDEFAVIKRHPGIGADILGGITEFPEIAHGARWHHERYDGRGYPDGLKGEEIPEIARIISVADAYDAMTSNRSYRPVMEQSRVRAEIERGRGAQFDPAFADIMLDMIDEDTEYRMKGQ